MTPWNDYYDFYPLFFKYIFKVEITEINPFTGKLTPSHINFPNYSVFSILNDSYFWYGFVTIHGVPKVLDTF